MNTKENNYELIKFKDGDFCLEVNVSPGEDTVWLTQKDMSLLFGVDRTVISRHISNIYLEGELDRMTSVHFLHISNNNPKNRPPELYNLDVIISVGYRVKSKRGVLFRKWATSVLREYLLKGYTINEERCLTCTSNILELKNKVEEIENKYIKLENTVYTTDKMVYEGELVEPLTLLRKLFFLAKKRIVIIDDYVDNTVLMLLKDIKTKTIIITSSNTYLNKEKDIPENICIIKENKEHDRAIFIDDYVYMFGTSFNAIGKERFTIIKVNHLPQEVFLKGINLDKYDTND